MVNKNKVIIVIVFVMVSFFVFRHYVHFSASLVEAVSSSVLYPLLRMQRAIIIPIAKWFEERATIRELERGLQQLQTTNEQLQKENNMLKGLRMHLDESEEVRAFNQRYDLSRGYMGQVLARHFSSTEHFFLVDAGSSQGIKKDMVALYCNSIVGKVTHVYPWYCKVSLVTDADCKIAATCVSAGAVSKIVVEGKIAPERSIKKGVHGIHEGCNDVLGTTVRYVSHLQSPHVGDVVLSSGEGLIFPKGFALGKITAAHKGELFYTIVVQPMIDLQSVRYCTLVAKEDIGLIIR